VLPCPLTTPPYAPCAQAPHVAALAISLGFAYTVFSEWLNVYVRQSWGYDPVMPTVTILG